MIFSYVVHDQGTRHLENNVPCQDSYCITDCGKGFKVAAVADGLGSCSKSQISAETAASAAASFIADNFPVFTEAGCLTALMITAMNYAYKAVYKKLKEEKIEIDDAHTTLSVCIFGENITIFGHSGDGVIIGLEKNGRYKILCEPIKGDRSNSTIPFTSATRSWKVNLVEEPLAAVLLATDGVGDVLYPYFLRPDHEVIQAYAEYFMHPKVLGIGKTPDAELSEELSEKTLKAIRNPSNQNWSDVTDDITSVIMVNTESDPPILKNAQTEKYLRKKLADFYGFTDKTELSHDNQVKNDVGNLPNETSDDVKNIVENNLDNKSGQTEVVFEEKTNIQSETSESPLVEEKIDVNSDKTIKNNDVAPQGDVSEKTIEENVRDSADKSELSSVDTEKNGLTKTIGKKVDSMKKNLRAMKKKKPEKKRK